MGFIQAMADIGKLDVQPGLESYLKLPLEKEGKVIRIYLDIENLTSKPLIIRGIKSIDLTDHICDAAMKSKYLYRDRVGTNVGWGFTPIYRIKGKPKATNEANLKDWIGKDGIWANDDKSCLFIIKNRVLKDYEKEKIIQPGATDIIMEQLEKEIPHIIDMLDRKYSHMAIFGGESNGQFVYPGDINAFVDYFELKLNTSLQSRNPAGGSQSCALCGSSGELTGLAKVFKFATMDKVSFLPGLDKNRADSVFGMCRDCLESITAGRERVERSLTSSNVIPRLNMWTIPEAVGEGDTGSVRNIVELLEKVRNTGEFETLDVKSESRLFQQLAKTTNKGLVFHFVFWESKKAQELVHLMIEDVPPERLALLERQWEEAFKSVIGDTTKGANLDWAIRSLYATLNRFAGKSESDKIVFRDLSLKIIGKMLRGEKMPVNAFKQAVVSRSSRLIFENDDWKEIRRSIAYAQVWVEYMHRINGR